ncbi:hypothetical protein SAMN05421770_101801 [Granulicella rosea]|uniref:Dolichyl-phosphate-mannose-protein mannosyltransferase n=1 Tax=Granulicella rosea TaxID=474952 RepID=A0A239E4P6_9BACT|nr:hypothetical protein [Granulicella rosea]SNS39720.1 hypothetical protein SAMN05421770_101801 [Granulicella rosea]
MDRETRRRWALTGLLLAGGLLRLTMIEHARGADSEAGLFPELSRNLLRGGAIVPEPATTPGYGLVLELLGGHVEWVLVLQSSLDLLGVTLLVRFLWRWSGERAGDLALALGALCVFTAAYAATPLPESLSVFAVMLGIWGYGQMMLARAPGWRRLLPVAAAGALAMLLSPDGVLLPAAMVGGILWDGRERWGLGRAVRAAAVAGLLIAGPLLPWAVGNWRTFHATRLLEPSSTIPGHGAETFVLPFAHSGHGFVAIAMGLLGLGYVVAGAMGFVRRLTPFAGWMIGYVVVRCLLAATLERRSIVETTPMLVVGAACWLGGRSSGRWGLRETVQAGESDLAELFAESFPVPERGGLELVKR